MEILTRTELQFRKKEILQKIRDGAVFICPTDTIYGLSCNALLESSVAKIRQLKQRTDSPFSVWIPSLQWIEKNCKLNQEAKTWVKKLPGPYTLILPLKNTSCLAKNVSPEQKTIGVRYPDHWFGKIVEEVNFPLVTTSANKAGQPFMTSIENMDPEVQSGVEFALYEGPKEARPSKIVNLTTGKTKGR